MKDTATAETPTPTTATTAKVRPPKVQFSIQKEGKHFGLYVEDQLVAVTVYRKGAATLEALLRNCVKYSGRNLFRTALEDALKAPATPAADEAPAADSKE